MNPVRIAVVNGDPSVIRRYMPVNYGVVYTDEANGEPEPTNVIVGRDVAGWTLEVYVIPRLSSGLHFATELTPKSTQTQEQAS